MGLSQQVCHFPPFLSSQFAQCFLVQSKFSFHIHATTSLPFRRTTNKEWILYRAYWLQWKHWNFGKVSLYLIKLIMRKVSWGFRRVSQSASSYLLCHCNRCTLYTIFSFLVSNDVRLPLFCQDTPRTFHSLFVCSPCTFGNAAPLVYSPWTHSVTIRKCSVSIRAGN